MKVRKAHLGRLEKIAAGGYGCVYKAPEFNLRGDPAPVAYKEFTTEIPEQGRNAAQAVSFWKQLDSGERADLADYVAWPRELVYDGSSVCGLLMPLLSDDFFCGQPDPKTGAPTKLPRAMKWLASTAAQRRAAAVDVPDIEFVDRDVLLAKLAYALGRLHRHGWVYGDLSFNNVAFALTPPRIQLLDCDSAAPVSDLSRTQAHTPFWAPPECQSDAQRLQDERTDVYKLGLMILRCLTPGKGVATTEDPKRLRGVHKANQRVKAVDALVATPSARPPAKEIYAEFLDLLDERITRPEVKAHLVTPFRLRGQDVSIEWEVEGAEELIVEAANGQRVIVDPKAHPHGIWFRPDSSGPVDLVARNRFGATPVELGEITLYELPAFKIPEPKLPRAVVPVLPAVSLAAADAALRDRPATGVGTSAGPIPGPDLASVLTAASPDARTAPALPRLDAPVNRAANTIRSSVMDGGAEVASAVTAAVARVSDRLTERRTRT
ncbi:MAG: hypothetical protein M3340_01870 [Actinomycetota bacterium]|nr:hypothetical protein [Actinomycetota bacterium]